MAVGGAGTGGRCGGIGGGGGGGDRGEGDCGAKGGGGTKGDGGGDGLGDEGGAIGGAGENAGDGGARGGGAGEIGAASGGTDGVGGGGSGWIIGGEGDSGGGDGARRIPVVTQNTNRGLKAQASATALRAAATRERDAASRCMGRVSVGVAASADAQPDVLAGAASISMDAMCDDSELLLTSSCSSCSRRRPSRQWPSGSRILRGLQQDCRVCSG